MFDNENEDKNKRRWARAMNRACSGVWGVDKNHLKTFELTTRQGDDQTWARMTKDFKNWVRAMRDRGYKFEYIASPEYSPKNHLLHLHGVMRTEQIIPHKVMSEQWDRIHGAPIVYIKKVRSEKGAIRYCVKHMLKEYPEAVGFKGRLLVSGGWPPKNAGLVRKVLVRWALERVDVYGKHYWAVMNDMYKRWCMGEQLLLYGLAGKKPLVLPGGVRG